MHLRTLLLVFAFGTVTAAEAEKGEAYAAVRLNEDGSVQVLQLETDLPRGAETVIRNWLQRQAIVFPLDSNETAVRIDYTLIDAENERQAMDMRIAETGVEMPARADAPQVIPVEVSVRLRADGSVASVEPITPLPEGVSERAITEAVRENLENDPVIQRAADENTLRESEHVLTVNIRAHDR